MDCRCYRAVDIAPNWATVRTTVHTGLRRAHETVAAWRSMDGKQGGDPALLASAIVQLGGLDEPPARFAAGADAVQTFEAKANVMLTQANALRDFSSSLAHVGE